MLALAGAAALATGLLPAATAQAVPVTTVDAVTFSSPSLTVSGLAMGAETVTAHITSPTPVAAGGWSFHLTRSEFTGSMLMVDVLPTLTAGTGTDGTWSATVQMPSIANGAWILAGVVPCAATCSGTPVVPAGSASFTVIGQHQPRISLGAVPSPRPYPQSTGTVKGRVYDSETGLGLAGVAVEYGSDGGCVLDRNYGPISFRVRTTTDRAGYYAFSRVGPTAPVGLQCVGVWGSVRQNSDGASVLPVYRSFAVAIKPLVTASAASRAKRGSSVAVLGKVFDWGYLDGRGRVVQIQKLHGRTAWRTVATVGVRLNARWNGTVVVTARGANVYRAVTPFRPNSAASTSRTFTITGT